MEITQLKNISMGGMCFVTSARFEPGTQLGIELKTPYLADTTYLEGVVLESHEKVMDIIYETRLKFEFLNPQAEFLLAKIIEFFINEEKNSYADKERASEGRTRFALDGKPHDSHNSHTHQEERPEPHH